MCVCVFLVWFVSLLLVVRWVFWLYVWCVWCGVFGTVCLLVYVGYECVVGCLFVESLWCVVWFMYFLCGVCGVVWCVVWCGV